MYAGILKNTYHWRIDNVLFSASVQNAANTKDVYIWCGGSCTCV